MARAEILTQLHDTIAACEELFQAHGEACSCELCCLVTNFVGRFGCFACSLKSPEMNALHPEAPRTKETIDAEPIN